MFKTYIYGTPLGFDFFEDISSLKEYFKGLYISSRKGRRLMVNRCDNGETFYNYLRYELTENGGRPNSFFGMSISIDNNEYAYDFKDIFDWFDSLFDRLVNRGSLFYVNAGGVIQYKVAKFKDVSDEIQWLKNNLPNLFTKRRVLLHEYNSSFSTSTSGQIRCFNDQTSNTKILDALKKCRWIALSPNFKQEEEPIEIDPIGIDAQLNKYTQQLVPIAISPKRENLETLRLIKNDCSGTIELVKRYLSSERDEDDRYSCALLIEKASDIVENADAIVKKIDNTGSYEHQPHLRKCEKCGKDLPLSDFASVDSQFCTNCETENRGSQTTQKKCSKCGKLKDHAEFSDDGETCKDCLQNPINDSIDARVFGFLGVVAIILGVSLFLILEDRKKYEPTSRTDETSEQVVSETSTEDNFVNNPQFNEYLKNNEFLSAYKELDGKNDSINYIDRLKSSIETYLWNLIVNSEKNPIHDYIWGFFISNKQLVDQLDIAQDTWSKHADAYDKLMQLIKEKSLSQSQRKTANELINNLPDYLTDIKESFRKKITNIPYAEIKKDNNKLTTTKPNFIRLIDPNGDEIDITSSGTYYFNEGEKITIKSDTALTLKGDVDNNVNVNNKRNKMTIEVKERKTVTVSQDTITITIKCNRFKTI